MASCSLEIQITNDCIETFKDENTALKLIVEKYENDNFNQCFSLLLQHPLIDINKLFLINNIREYLSKNETFNSIIKLNALHLAILNGHLEVVKLLCENSKIDINILKVEEINKSLNDKEEKMIEKDSPLHVAVKNTSHHQIEIIEILMKNSFIDLKIEDSDGKTPYYCAKNSLIKELLSSK